MPIRYGQDSGGGSSSSSGGASLRDLLLPPITTEGYKRATGDSYSTGNPQLDTTDDEAYIGFEFPTQVRDAIRDAFMNVGMRLRFTVATTDGSSVSTPVNMRVRLVDQDGDQLVDKGSTNFSVAVQGASTHKMTFELASTATAIDATGDFYFRFDHNSGPAVIIRDVEVEATPRTP